jgi:hypothetical protein
MGWAPLNSAPLNIDDDLLRLFVDATAIEQAMMADRVAASPPAEWFAVPRSDVESPDDIC